MSANCVAPQGQGVADTSTTHAPPAIIEQANGVRHMPAQLLESAAVVHIGIALFGTHRGKAKRSPVSSLSVHVPCPDEHGSSPALKSAS